MCVLCMAVQFFFFFFTLICPPHHFAGHSVRAMRHTHTVVGLQVSDTFSPLTQSCRAGGRCSPFGNTETVQASTFHCCGTAFSFLSLPTRDFCSNFLEDMCCFAEEEVRRIWQQTHCAGWLVYINNRNKQGHLVTAWKQQGHHPLAGQKRRGGRQELLRPTSCVRAWLLPNCTAKRRQVCIATCSHEREGGALQVYIRISIQNLALPAADSFQNRAIHFLRYHGNDACQTIRRKRELLSSLLAAQPGLLFFFCLLFSFSTCVASRSRLTSWNGF